MKRVYLSFSAIAMLLTCLFIVPANAQPGTSTPDWNYVCADNQYVEVIGSGTQVPTAPPTILNIPQPMSDIDSIVTEVVFKGASANLPTSATIMTNNGQTVTNSTQIILPNFGSNEVAGVFRTTLNPASQLMASVAPSAAGNYTWAFIAYVYRSGSGKSSSGVYTSAVVLLNSYTITLPLPVTPGPKNVTVSSLLSELNSDPNRIVLVNATAGGVTALDSVEFPNVGTSLNITNYTLSNVPASTTSITITYDSPISLPGGIFGDSFMPAVNVTVENCPCNISLALTPTNASCNGSTDGSVDATVTGGTAPLAYSWSNGATTEDLTNVGAGIYTITVTDANQCNATSSVIVTEPSAVVANITASVNVSVNGGGDGSATVTASGGTQPYTYLWSDNQTTQTASNLSAGTYTVIVSDANQCTDTDQVIITEPDSLTITTTSTNLDCFGDTTGTASVTSVNGGVSPYTYLWSNGGTTATISGLGLGTYMVTVTDANGASAIGVEQVSGPQLPLSATSIDINENCFGGLNGSIDLTPSGGTPGYTYLWSTGATTQDLIAIAGGTYTVTITDANGCTHVYTTTLTEPDPLVVTETHVDVLCNGDATGSIDLTVTGGTTPYTFSWSNGQTVQNLSNLSAGPYTVFVTDASLATGCTALLTINITEPTAVTAGATSTDILCFGDQTGTASASASGGTPGYTYAWSNGSTDANISGLGAGTYTVTATDANGCTASNSTTITQPQNAVAVNITGSTNVSINGGSDGTASAASSGGTSPYSMVWSNGDTGPNADSLSAGTYTVTTTDANGCSATATVTITEPNQLVITTTHTDILCTGDSTGTASVTSVSGGVPPTSYLWSNGGTTQTITGLVAGPYTVTVTDINGATATGVEIVLEPASALSATSIDIDENCFGGLNGSINLLPTGGTLPYSFLWSTGATTQNIVALAGGAYTVTITDFNNCTHVYTTTLTEPDSFAVSETHVDVLCNGDATGSIDLTVTGGTTPYIYSWSNGATIEDLSNLTAGPYTVFVTDASLATGCTAQLTINITEPTAVTAGATSTDVLCFGDQTGTASASASGGTPGYTYAWSNGSTDANISGLGAGTYTVTATDANGCTGTASTTVSQPANAVAVNITGSTNVSINGGSDGTASAASSGGTSPYSMVWSNGDTGPNADSLSAGTYTVTTTDANGCSATATVTITEPNQLVITTTHTDILCTGDSTSTASVTSVSGGVPPTSYLWSNGGTTQTITGLVAGPYTVTVTDINGATATGVEIVLEPATAVTCTLNVDKNVSCFGGSNGQATVVPSGGTPGYTYLWSNGQTTQNGLGLAAGTYTITVTDVNQCSTTCTVTITEPAELTCSITSSTDISCNGGNDGSATVTATGGTQPYLYQWSDGQSTATASNLAAGTYTVTVRDQNGSTDACSTTCTVTINEPPVLTCSIVGTDPLCAGDSTGTAVVTAIGGTPGSGGNPAASSGFSATTSDIISVGTIPVALACEGNYAYMVDRGTDKLVIVDISNPPSLSIVSNFAVGPRPNAIAVSGNYAYVVDMSTDDLRIIDVSNPSSPFLAGTMALGAKPRAIEVRGNYAYIIDNGSDDLKIVDISNPATPAITGTKKLGFVPYDIALSGNFAYVVDQRKDDLRVINISNPLSPQVVKKMAVGPLPRSIVVEGNYAYITDGATDDLKILDVSNPYSPVLMSSMVVGTNPYSVFVMGNYAYITDPGTDELKVIDVSNASSPVLAGTHPLGSAPFAAEVDGNYAFVLDFRDADFRSIQLNTGGTANSYTYVWSTGATTDSISGLGSGTYTVTVTDANNCTTTCSITITEPAPLTCTAVNTGNVSCNGGNDGSATVSANGGTAPYSYNWGGANPDSLSAGTYTVTVTDANQCSSTCSVVITGPPAFNCSVKSIDPVSCFGGNDGSATVLANGGIAPYTYNWSNGQTTATATGLVAGNYTIIISDDNQCTSTCMVTINEPGLLTCTITDSADVSCNGGNDGSAIVMANGGTPPYSYSWSDGQTTSIASGLMAGTHTITITDANQCTSTCTVTITEPDSLTCAITNSSDVTCNGGNDGSATVTANGGTAPYSYNWSNGQTNSTATGLMAGTYTVIVSDASGNSSCVTTCTVTITEPAPLTCTAVNTGNVSCNGGNDGSASVSANGGTAPYSYNWGGANPDSLSAGTYTVTVTDANLCSSTCSVTITEPAPLTCTAVNTGNVSCNGGNDGSASVSANGGTAPYSYNWGGANPDSLSAGTYTVTVTDANLCSSTCSVTITEPAPLTCTAVNTGNVSCNGGNDGSASVSANGGTAPYSYNWGGANPDSLSAGTYTVTVTDANLCSSTCSVTITEPAPLTCTAVNTGNVSCNGGNDGSASVSANGGTAPYSYNWGGANPDSLSAGTYTVTVTDANLCSSTCSVTITEPAPLTCTAVNTGNVSCNGGNDGSASVSANGGTAPYSYNWGGANPDSLSAGTYTVTVTDANLCSSTCSVEITEPPLFYCSVKNVDPVSCFGGNDGSATVLANGGTAPYTYNWSSGQTTAAASGLTTGTYTITITDANLCTSSCTITINEPGLLTCTITDSADVSCNGGNDGSAIVMANGGTPPYSYSWSDGQTTSIASGLMAGTYTITITDANQCTSSCTVTITEPDSLTCTITNSSDVTCNGGIDGSATVAASGGTAPYTYNWSNGQTTATVTGLMAGTYTVMVSDASGNSSCVTSCTVTINQPDTLTCAITNSSDVTCNGGNDGSATVTASGGTVPYTYNWSNGQTTATATGLMAGTYTVVVTDASGNSSCVTTCTVTINQPNPIVVTLTPENESCFGLFDGSIDASVNGGTGTYTYSWSNGATTEDISNLGAGTYTLIVIDANGCVGSSTTTITTDAAGCACVGDYVWIDSDGDGIQDSNETGYPGLIVHLYTCDTVGTFPTPGTGTLVGTDTTDANGEYLFCDLPAGNYTVVFGNAPAGYIYTTANAGTNDSIDSDVMMNGGKECFYLPPGDTNLTCDAGLLELASIGDFVWNDLNMDGIQDPGETGVPGIIVYLYDSVGNLVATDTTDANGLYLFNNLVPGDYNVCVEPTSLPFGYTFSPMNTTADSLDSDVDATGCMMVTTLDPGEEDLTWDAGIFEQVGCVGDFVWVDSNADGIQDSNETGYPGLIVQLYTCDTVGTFPTPGTGTLVGTDTTDANGEYLFCDLPAGNFTVVFGNAPAGYIYTTANAGTNDSIDSDVMMNGGKECFYLPPGDTNLTCDAGLIELASIGDLVWQDDNQNGIQDSGEVGVQGFVVYLQDCQGNNLDTAVTNANGNYLFDNLVPGDYKITFDVSSLPADWVFTLINQGNDSLDSDANAASGGMTICTTLDPGENDLTWDAGIYPCNIQVTAIPSPVLCTGDASGSIIVTVSNGIAPYTFLWNDGSTDQNRTGLTAGTYTVTVFDSNGCDSDPETVTVTEPTQLLVAANGTDVLCYGDNNGTATAQAFGGTPNYTYSWSNGATDAAISNLGPGIYTVTAIDANNCTATATVLIQEPTPFTCNLNTILHISCNGANDGVLAVNGVGGTPGYTYLWNTGATTMQISNLGPGNYSVTVTDANNCTSTCAATILQPNPLICIASTDANVNCNTGNDGSASVLAIGGTSPYTFVWSDGQTGMNATGLSAGIYTVTVTDNNNCTSTCTTEVTEPTPVNCTVLNTGNVSCNGGNDGSASVSATGGTPNYSFVWSNGQTGMNASGLSAGVYTATVTDANNCSSTCTVEITEPPVLSCTTSNTGNVSCNGGNDGSASVSATGGTPNYSFVWSNGQTGMNATGLSAGVYTATVTDANNCSSTCTVEITETTPVSCTISNDGNVSCNGGNDGSASVSATGGTTPYTFVWSNGQTGMNATGLSAGIYTATVTDANNCSSTCTVEITEPDPLSCNATGDTVACGATDGSVSVSANGGTPAYSYLWTTGDTTATVNNLGGGVYTVTVTDANGCSTTCSAEIIDLPPPTISVCPDQEVGYIPPTCDCDGKIVEMTVIYDGPAGATVSVGPNSSGSNPYTNTNTQPGDTLIINLGNIGNDWYYLVNGVQDGNIHASCSDDILNNVNSTKSDFGHLGSYPNPDQNSNDGTFLVIGFMDDNGNICPAGGVGGILGGAIANINVDNVSGGTAPYTYLWSTGETIEDIMVNIGANTTYTVTVTDANGCTATADHTVTVVDITCPSNPDEVMMCDNGSPKCEKKEDIAKKLGDGYTLGPCGKDFSQPNACGSFMLFCPCEGGIQAMGVIYNGAPGATVAFYDGSVSAGNLVASYTNLQPGDSMLFSGNGNKFSSGSNFTINGGPAIDIHLSCSQPVQGETFGGVLYVYGTQDDQGNCCNLECPPPPPAPCACSGKIVEMDVVYDGPAGASINVGPNTTPSSNATLYTNVQPGDTLNINLGNIGNNWYYSVNGIADADIHTSCSDDILGNVNSSKSDFGNLGNYPNPNVGNNRGTFLVVRHVDENGNVCSLGQQVPRDYSNSNIAQQLLQLQAYPNPTTGLLNVTFVADDNENYNIELLDMTGRLVFNEINASHSGVNFLSYDFSHLPKGIYILQVNMENNAERLRVVID